MSYLKQREVWDLRWENSAGYWAGCWKTMWASTVWKHVTIGMKKRVRECVFLLFNELLWYFQQHLQSESESLGLIHCSPSCSNRPPVAFGGHKSFLTADLCIQVRSTFEKWNVTYCSPTEIINFITRGPTTSGCHAFFAVLAAWLCGLQRHSVSAALLVKSELLWLRGFSTYSTLFYD